ncbi:MAG: NAD(+)/NADH kinase [Promicromonosporaceae bacterium]|nr:NAD(+)/NADH kinase [Promicromonosporaceae bacterium]
MRGPTLTTCLHPALVFNPSKAGADRALKAAQRECERLGMAPPALYETTVEHPGGPQARQALREGADLIIAAGGDGTVRQVASALAGAKVPLGVVPLGTGNLFARNLDLPLANLQAALRVALDGRVRPVDVGRLRVLEPELGLDGRPRSRSARRGEEHVFLVIAGVGFDASMIAATDARLKRRLGWAAYFIAGLPRLLHPRIRVTTWLDDGPAQTGDVRTLLVGNCGRIPGLTLLPDARPDDGLFDVAAIDTRGGLVGWAQLASNLALQSAGAPTPSSARSAARLQHTQARRTVIEVHRGAQAQVDGDPIGHVAKVEAWVEPGALLVRAPLGRPRRSPTRR